MPDLLMLSGTLWYTSLGMPLISPSSFMPGLYGFIFILSFLNVMLYLHCCTLFAILSTSKERKPHQRKMTMMTLDEIRVALQDRRLSTIARATGLHYNVLYSFASGKVKNPSYETVRKIHDYLTGAADDKTT